MTIHRGPQDASLQAWLREQILQLWEKNKAAVDIARQLNPELKNRGARTLLTRNAIIGHVYRARQAGDPRAVPRQLPTKTGPQKNKPLPPKAPENPEVKALPTKGVSLSPVSFLGLKPVRNAESLENKNLTTDWMKQYNASKGGKKTVLTVKSSECHFPLDDFAEDGRRVYCGLEAISTSRQYCPYHNQIVYRRIQPTENMNAQT